MWRIYLPIVRQATPTFFFDQFAGSDLDRTQWDTFAGAPTVRGGQLSLDGATTQTQVQSTSRFGYGVLQVAIERASEPWPAQDASPGTDASFGLEIWDGANGACHHAVTFTAGGHLAVLLPEPDADGSCSGDPAHQEHLPVSNWEELRRSRKLYVRIEWHAGHAALYVSDGASHTGVAVSLEDDVTADVLRIRLNAVDEEYRIDYAAFRADDYFPEDGAYQGVAPEGVMPCPSDPSPLLDLFDVVAAKRPHVVKVYQAWKDGGFYGNEDPSVCGNWAEIIRSRGAIEFLSLDPEMATDDGVYNLHPAEVMSSQYDEVIEHFAEQIRDWEQPILMSTAGEMNGCWGTEGDPDDPPRNWQGCWNDHETAAAQYVEMYRYIYRIFRRIGAANVVWVWVINHQDVPDEEWNRAENYYPGDEYVDMISIDGYNWGNYGKETCPSAPWKPFDELFAPMLARMRACHGPKPLAIGELGCAEDADPSRKATWIADAYRRVATEWPEIKVVVWFDLHNDCRLEVESSAASMEAYRKALADPYYSTRPVMRSVLYGSHDLAGHGIAAECNPGGGTACDCSPVSDAKLVVHPGQYGEVISNPDRRATWANAIAYKKFSGSFPCDHPIALGTYRYSGWFKLPTVPVADPGQRENPESVHLMMQLWDGSGALWPADKQALEGTVFWQLSPWSPPDQLGRLLVYTGQGPDPGLQLRDTGIRIRPDTEWHPFVLSVDFARQTYVSLAVWGPDIGFEPAFLLDVPLARVSHLEWDNQLAFTITTESQAAWPQADCRYRFSWSTYFRDLELGSPLLPW